jgi:hypothetical protein
MDVIEYVCLGIVAGAINLAPIRSFERREEALHDSVVGCAKFKPECEPPLEPFKLCGRRLLLSGPCLEARLNCAHRDVPSR